MKAENPLTGKIVYFVDKCLPFGASISCSHFQTVSNGLKHITGYLIRKRNCITNYMDDFLFIDITRCGANYSLQVFCNMCEDIAFPVSEEKTCKADFPGSLTEWNHPGHCCTRGKEIESLESHSMDLFKKESDRKRSSEINRITEFSEQSDFSR